MYIHVQKSVQWKPILGQLLEERFKCHNQHYLRDCETLPPILWDFYLILYNDTQALSLTTVKPE